MELYKYYTLEEVSDRESIISNLKLLKEEGKINFELDGEVFKLDDLDLDDIEIESLIQTFEDYDVFPYLEIDDEEYNNRYGDYEDDY